MLTGIFQTVIILWAATTFYVVDFILIGTYDKQRCSSGTGRSWDYTVIMLLTVAVVAAQPVLLPWAGIKISNAGGLAMQMLGVALLAVSLRLNVWARRHLQHFYSERVELQSEHRFIDTGPYAYVRHPVFTSLFGLVIGLLLVSPSLPTIILAIYTFGDFIPAARREEELLSKNLPGYISYMKRTNAFIPVFCKLKEA
jgi:protein-S-isoprenylcysteine O-methyltransferase Ste14